MHLKKKTLFDRDREWFITHMGEQLGKHFEATFHSICPKSKIPIFADFVNPYRIYEDLQDMSVLRKYLEGQMEEYNHSPGVVKMDLVLFEDAIEHICRIERVISQPRGNILLVGIGMNVNLISILLLRQFQGVVVDNRYLASGLTFANMVLIKSRLREATRFQNFVKI